MSQLLVCVMIVKRQVSFGRKLHPAGWFLQCLVHVVILFETRFALRTRYGSSKMDLGCSKVAPRGILLDMNHGGNDPSTVRT